MRTYWFIYTPVLTVHLPFTRTSLFIAICPSHLCTKIVKCQVVYLRMYRYIKSSNNETEFKDTGTLRDHICQAYRYTDLFLFLLKVCFY